MKYIWKDLPERKNLFTVKNTTMINLNTGKAVRHYCTNTKIAVVQNCVTPGKTYYRTSDAAHNYLNYAFEAEAFGLPNEIAPSVRSLEPKSSLKSDIPAARTHQPVKKQTSTQQVVLPKDGEARHKISWIRRIFRRKNG